MRRWIFYLQYEGMLEAQGEKPVKAWMRLVNVYRETGNYPGCLELTQKLLDHYSEEGNLSSLAVLHNNMGYYHTELGQIRAGIDAL